MNAKIKKLVECFQTLFAIGASTAMILGVPKARRALEAAGIKAWHEEQAYFESFKSGIEYPIEDIQRYGDRIDYILINDNGKLEYLGKYGVRFKIENTTNSRPSIKIKPAGHIQIRDLTGYAGLEGTVSIPNDYHWKNMYLDDRIVQRLEYSPPKKSPN